MLYKIMNGMENVPTTNLKVFIPVHYFIVVVVVV